MPKTVHFLYGFGEGTWHSKKFRRVLIRHGFSVVDSLDQAGIVIVHSAGAFYVPKLRDDQWLMLINPPYWPGKSTSKRAREKVRYDLAHAILSKHLPYFLKKTFWNVAYGVGRLGHTRLIMRTAPTYHLRAELRHKRTILVRNNDDAWLTPDLDHLKKAIPRLKIHHLTGEHDDCWYNPQPYVNLLQSELGEPV